MRNWPFFELSVTTPRLQLRFPSLEDLDELADRAAEGVHGEGFMPFLVPWSEGTPEERARSTVQYRFRQWAALTPESWTLDFVVVVDGRVVGAQEVSAEQFAVTREVTTGSWLGHRFQGQGIGTEMRRAVLHLAFAGLGARWAVTSAFEDNPASLGVTSKLGYREDGVSVFARKGEPAINRRFRMAREHWTEPAGMEIKGLEPCLPLLGL
ncbi:GNAT family N-acetyltransferase [Nonomuraea pusilla]|uniref:Protein N-acetyltransferase, RimJ/RimL family n=1 Tax=Nonomuraea pusilla TaxID=46177 RepID=A0A1H8B7C4_9ACTN|nr:GNAT family N-acetyltransferase [Nonomuraea pusilla]SEM78626.1 Protein N-acetyltransferase, RimJ/RimL family [Nonomuraea pusilla]